MGQVYTCPSCAKKIEDGHDCSLIRKEGDVEIRAHAERRAMPAMLRSPGAAEGRVEGRDTEKEALNAKLVKVGAAFDDLSVVGGA